MNIVLSNKFLVLPMCYVGGYALNVVWLKISKFAGERLEVASWGRVQYKAPDKGIAKAFFRNSIVVIQ